MQYLKTEQELTNDKTEKYYESIVKACEKLHVVAVAMKKSEKARNILKSEDKMAIWNVLQEYLREYADFINSHKRLTGMEVYKVDKNYFETITLTELKRQVKGAIAFVYLKEAMITIAKETFKQCLKSVLKETKMFSEKEISFFD